MIASSNNISNIIPALRSRFFIIELEPYTYEQFFQITMRLLIKQHKVLMPFTDDLNKIYEIYVKPTIEGKHLQCLRADDFKTGTNIMEDIWHSICRSRIIIADVTYFKPM